jgi:hypothetical protein
MLKSCIFAANNLDKVGFGLVILSILMVKVKKAKKFNFFSKKYLQL